MLENWSLVLNILMLIGVIMGIVHMINVRKQGVYQEKYQPSLGINDNLSDSMPAYNDDIIAVRKVIRDELLSAEMDATASSATKATKKQTYQPPILKATPVEAEPLAEIQPEAASGDSKTVMLFLLSRENRQFAGYELLQTVLAAGFRFGEGQLFHRHQLGNGQGPVLCSLAAATATGVFDLQNIGAFSVRGLCLFMQTSRNPGIDAERFQVMLDAGKQLSEGLDAFLLDDQRKPLTEASIARYQKNWNGA